MPFRRTYYFLQFPVILAATFTIASCNKGNSNDDYTDPYPFPVLPEDNTGTRTRSITYVYDRTAVDLSYPPKIDSSVILFSYNAAGKIDRLRLTNNDLLVYDFSFERSNNKLTAIRCRYWHVSPTSNPEVNQGDLELQYDASGKICNAFGVPVCHNTIFYLPSLFQQLINSIQCSLFFYISTQAAAVILYRQLLLQWWVVCFILNRPGIK